MTLRRTAPPATVIAVVDASGTELTEYQIFNFAPEDVPTLPPRGRVIATNETTGRVYLLGHNAYGITTVGVFDPARQAPNSPDAQEFVLIPIPDFIEQTGIAVDSRTNHVYVAGVYVAGQTSGGVAIVDGETQSLAGVLAFDDELYFPAALDVNEATNRVYVSGSGATTSWALAEVDVENNSFEIIQTGDDAPWDMAVVESSNELFLVGEDNPSNTGQVQVLDLSARTMRTIPLGADWTYGISVNPATGSAYVVGFDDNYEGIMLVIGQPHCDAAPKTLDTLRNEVLALPTSDTTVQRLDRGVNSVRWWLERGNTESARLAIARFITRVVRFSNYEVSNPDRIEPALANSLVCSASNVLFGVEEAK